MTETGIRALIAAAAAALWAYFGEIAVPVAVLMLVMLSDYITGVAAAWVAGELSSRTGIVGVIKKIGYLFLVAVGCVIDYLITLAGGSLGIVEAGMVKFAALLVIFWLIVNELISILENVRKIGVPVPPWLGGILNRLKHQSEAAAPQTEETEVGKHERR